MSITHEVYKSFDEDHKVRSVFLDISKAFDKVWPDGLIFKLTQKGIPGNLLKLLRDFLSEIRQRVVLNGQASTWTNINAGVPQGFILGPLLFLIYINDISENSVQMLSYLRTIHLYFPLFMTARLLQMFSTRFKNDT